MKRRKETLGLLWDMGPDSGPGKNGNWSMERKFARIVCTTPVDEACQGCAGIQRRDWSNKREGEKGLNEPDCYPRARTRTLGFRKFRGKQFHTVSVYIHTQAVCFPRWVWK